MRKSKKLKGKRSKPKTNGGLVFLMITIVSVLAFGFLTPAGQRTMDVWRDEWRSTQNKVYYKMGRPLPGTPDLSRRDERFLSKNLNFGDPIFMRIFKLEGELELWVRSKNKKKFVLFATYPICRWSGGLGPKLKEGDGQSPEGVYTVRKNQLNPNSRWYRSFNLGYPNLYDRSYKRTGSFLMVHGGCSSIGCYAMTNGVMKEIWEIVTATYAKGHRSFGVHAFPFRMSERNMAVYNKKDWELLWSDLKTAYDLFNETHIPPKVGVCQRRYVVSPGSMADKTYLRSLKQDCSHTPKNQEKAKLSL